MRPVAVPIGVDERMRIQLGLVTRAQARAAGLTRSMIATRLTSKAWEVVLPGVYRSATVPRTAEQQALSHCLHLGPNAYASHASAAWLWGLSGFSQPEKVHVSTGRGKESRSDEVVVHTRRDGLAEGYTFRRGVPTTLLARTILDLAPSLTTDRLEIVLDSGWRIHRDLFDELDEFISHLRPRGRTGIATLIDLVMLRRGSVPTDSDFETQVLQRVRKAGLVEPVLQHPIADAQGSIPLHRGDLVWPDLKVVLLPDGLTFHKTKFQFEKDAAVRARLTALGWRYVSVPRGQLDEPSWLWAISQMVPKAQLSLHRQGPRRPRRPTPPRRPRRPRTEVQLDLPEPTPSR